jgi:CRP/FNR family transcriptional regulator, cyclic AMP receptor protein
MAPKAKRTLDATALLAAVGQDSATRVYRKRQPIFLQADPADAVFFLERGKVKLTVISRQGKQAVVALLGPGDFFGEGCLAGQPHRMATASTLADCVLVRMTRAAIVRVLHEEPEFSEFFISHLLSRDSRIEEDLIDQLFNSSEKRLARTLLLLANFGQEGKPEPILAKISQQTLAEMVGTTRSRVSFFMNKFRRLGLIDYNGSIHVRQSLLNRILHEAPEIKTGDDKSASAALSKQHHLGQKPSLS